jgi:hypothetical protein
MYLSELESMLDEVQTGLGVDGVVIGVEMEIRQEYI